MDKKLKFLFTGKSEEKNPLSKLKSNTFFATFTLLLFYGGVFLPSKKGNELNFERKQKLNCEKVNLILNKF